MKEIKICEKYALTPEEASAYFNIGINKLRQMIRRNPNASWVLWNGTHACVKRKLFEEYLDAANAI